MQQGGIYIPEQDASWERETDMFDDLDTEAPLLCHAKLCFCPHDTGRAHHSEDGLWEILKCDACGSKVRNRNILYALRLICVYVKQLLL